MRCLRLRIWEYLPSNDPARKGAWVLSTTLLFHGATQQDVARREAAHRALDPYHAAAVRGEPFAPRGGAAIRLRIAKAWIC